MTYPEIANMPTKLTRKDVQEDCKGWHESLLRSYHIVQKVKILLEKNTSPELVLELIALMESDACQPYGFHEEQYQLQKEPGEIKSA